MIRVVAGLGSAVVVAVIAACGGSSSTTSTPTAASSSTTSTTATTGGTGTAGGAVNVNLDPCQLVTASEASSLAGATFGTGTEQTNTDTAGGGTSRICIYGGTTANVFEVLVAQASSASVAQADWAAQEAKVQSSLSSASSNLPPGTNMQFNVNDTSISGADKAAAGTISATISGQTLAGSAVYVLKGAAFAAITDITVGHAAPAVSAMEGQASTTLGRM